MSTTVWLGGFVAFMLGGMHLSSYFIFRSKFHLWLAIGWLGNIGYLYLERQVETRGLDSLIPLFVSVALLAFFLLARRSVSALANSRIFAELAFGFTVTLGTFVLAGVFDEGFWLRSLGGAIFSAYVYSSLGVDLNRLDLSDIKTMFLGERANLLYPSDGTKPAASFLPVDTLMESRKERALWLATVGKLGASLFFMAFGVLQLAYPLREFLESYDPLAWRLPFWIGMAIKTCIGISFVTLLVSHMRLVEVLARRVDISADLAKITASVEHDMRGPIGELGLIISEIEKRARENHPRYGSFLRDIASELAYIQARADAVTDMVMAMRLSPEEFSSSLVNLPIGEPLRRAMISVRSLHPSQIPVFHLEGFSPNTIVHGDSVRLVQVFRNIMNNSIEAVAEISPDSRPKIFISSRVNRDANTVTISFKDEGAGIEEDLLPTVTEAGISTKYSAEDPNRGLGLFIARRLVEMHHGELRITNRPNRGTEVLVQLPIA